MGRSVARTNGAERPALDQKPSMVGNADPNSQVYFLRRYLCHRPEEELLNLIVSEVVHTSWSIIKRIRRPGSYILGAVIFGLLCQRLYQSWQSLPADSVVSVDVGQLVFSLLLLWISYLFVSSEWLLTLRALGEKLPWRVGARIWFLSLAMRYLPGMVWGYLGRAYLTVERSVTKSVTVTSLVAESVLRVLSELMVFALSLWLWADGGQARPLSIALVGLCIIGLVLFSWIASDVGFQHRLAKMSWFRSISWPKIKFIHVLGLFVYFVVTVLMVGLAFYWFADAIFPLPFLAMPILAGILAIASTVGFLFPLAPQGWGIREGILVSLLVSQQVPLAAALMIGVGSRVWFIIGEGIWVVVATRL